MSLPTGESVFPLLVLVVEQTALVPVFEVPIMAGPLVRESPPAPDDPNDGGYIRLAPTLGNDGTSITIQEQSDGRAKCATALEASTGAAMAGTRRMIELACGSLGRYAWRSGRFVRDAPRAVGTAER